jgi:predicted nuclease with TOPRIM domain
VETAQKELREALIQAERRLDERQQELDSYRQRAEEVQNRAVLSCTDTRPHWELGSPKHSYISYSLSSFPQEQRRLREQLEESTSELKIALQRVEALQDADSSLQQAVAQSKGPMSQAIPVCREKARPFHDRFLVAHPHLL